MYLAALSALALAVTGVHGYENSSPLFIYSTSHFDLPTNGLASASQIQKTLSESLKQCPTKNYVVVSQPGVSASDFSCSRNTPLLRDRLRTANKYQTSLTIRDVIDTIDTKALLDTVQTACELFLQQIDASTGTIPEQSFNNNLVHIELPTLKDDLTPDQRHVLLVDHDLYVSSLIDNYFNSEDYTLLYTTSSVHATKSDSPSAESAEYHAELPLADMMHSGELRRSLVKRKDNSSSNQTIVDGPLFDKYQFLSPGIFMGGVVTFILVMILYVGISALSSLQVTYGAFDKDQGQLATKKQ